MVVNLYVDHMMSTPPASAEEVWNATREHAKLYGDAARRIGMSDKEYQEFRNALLDGKALYVTLPHKIDVMAGNRHGNVYAVRSAVLPASVMGWKVKLSSGAVIYVPQACGNLSLTRERVVRPIVAEVHQIYRPVVQHVAVVPPPPPAPPETPVVFTPPPPPVPPLPPMELAPPPAAAPVYAPVAAPVVTQARSSGFGLLFIPIVLWFERNVHTTITNIITVPPCSQGSNAMGVCQTPSVRHLI
jgi:hypothetical protein